MIQMDMAVISLMSDDEDIYSQLHMLPCQVVMVDVRR